MRTNKIKIKTRIIEGPWLPRAPISFSPPLLREFSYANIFNLIGIVRPKRMRI